MKIDYHQNNITNILVYLAPILVVLAQIPYFRGNVISKALSFSGLLLAVMFICIKKIKVDMKKVSAVLMLTILLLSFVAICFLCTGNSYFLSTTISSVLITVVTFIVFSVIFGGKNSYINMNKLIEVMIQSIVILAVFIFLYLSSQGFTFVGRYYYYGESKNLVAFIVAFGSVLLLVMLREKRLRLIHIVEFSFCSYVELMLKSRTSLVCWLIGIVLVVLFYYRSKVLKALFFFALILLAIIIFNNESIHDLIINNIVAAGRNINDINDLTSGRIDGFYLSYELFESSPLIGVGNNYIDNNVLMWLSQHGLIGFFLIVSILFCLISRIRFCHNRDFKIILLIVFAMLLINGLMESYAPFGPGTKVFCCWVLLSAYDSECVRDFSKESSYGIR